MIANSGGAGHYCFGPRQGCTTCTRGITVITNSPYPDTTLTSISVRPSDLRRWYSAPRYHNAPQRPKIAPAPPNRAQRRAEAAKQRRAK